MNDGKSAPSAQNSRTDGDDRLASITVGERQPSLNSSVYLAPYNPEWPELFSQLATRIVAALADRALLLEHVGSTSVPGLCAKPIIDILLAVKSSADECSYVPALEAQGFALRIREPDWFDHRLLKSADIAGNLHVFSAGCPEIDRMLAFRDRLRMNEHDRRQYEETKVALAARTWAQIQDYADAKSEVVREILSRSPHGRGWRDCHVRGAVPNARPAEGAEACRVPPSS